MSEEMPYSTPDEPELASDEADEGIATQDRRTLARAAFSPSQPIRMKELFHGRRKQMNDLLDVIYDAGRHALIYGERGVGKTSLSRVVESVIQASPNCLAVYETLESSDTFETIWRRVFRGVTIQVQGRQNPGFTGGREPTHVSLADILPANPTSHDVVQVLAVAQRSAPKVVVFLDEFDRPTDLPTRVAFADLIKLLADRGEDVTLVLIGVARAVGELIREHESITRHLAQIEMPLMGSAEISGIILTGMSQAQLSVDGSFVAGVVAVAQGLPHYAHLIGQHAATDAAEDADDVVDYRRFKLAVRAALASAMQTVRETYVRAVTSHRQTLHRDVLTACALAERDELGTFGSAQVREQLNRIRPDKQYDIPHFSSHLNEFSEQDGHRGRILTKTVGVGHFRYRFIDPLLPPYVLMQAHADDVLS